MPTSIRPARLLFVHAHPDDETLATGLAMAEHVLLGDEVHLLTCTLGEEGEIIPPELAHLGVDGEDRLGAYRRGELARAMRCLGVREVVLGEESGQRGYRDSGMAGAGANAHPRALCRAGVEEVAGRIRAHLRQVQPDVVVTYEDQGGYLHPDHVHTHRAVVAAVAGLPAHQRPELLAVVVPQPWVEEDRAWLAEHVDPADGLDVPCAGSPFAPNVVPAQVPTHVVEAGEQARAARDAALREHRTQVTVYDGYYALSNDVAARLTRAEAYVRLDPATGRPAEPGPGLARAARGLAPRRP